MEPSDHHQHVHLQHFAPVVWGVHGQVRHKPFPKADTPGGRIPLRVPPAAPAVPHPQGVRRVPLPRFVRPVRATRRAIPRRGRHPSPAVTAPVPTSRPRRTVPRQAEDWVAVTIQPPGHARRQVHRARCGSTGAAASNLSSAVISCVRGRKNAFFPVLLLTSGNHYGKMRDLGKIDN